mmetsp:Transcript_86617/g.150801  ORF Transcript_86617/g.150801 Transcript_86617/m.150801 type:complete len:89 (+) Transcript_86617:234-500(+)
MLPLAAAVCEVAQLLRLHRFWQLQSLQPTKSMRLIVSPNESFPGLLAGPHKGKLLVAGWTSTGVLQVFEGTHKAKAYFHAVVLGDQVR